MCKSHVAGEPGSREGRREGGEGEEGRGRVEMRTECEGCIYMYILVSVHINLYDRCVGIQRHRHGLHIPCSTVKPYNCVLALGSLVSIYGFEYMQITRTPTYPVVSNY